MPKYIDADEFFFVFKELDKEPYNTFHQIEADSLEEVIYCKDCRFYNTHDHRCVRTNHGFKDDFFCSWGERKEDAEKID